MKIHSQTTRETNPPNIFHKYITIKISTHETNYHDPNVVRHPDTVGNESPGRGDLATEKQD